MLHKHGKITLLGSMLLLLFLLAACGYQGDTGTASSGSVNTTITVTTHQGSSSKTPVVVVTPKVKQGSSKGASGNSPIVVTSPTLVPGGHANTEQVVLKDRTLIITSVSKQSGASANTCLITLTLTVENTSSKTIMNQATFFQLMGTEGDTFSYQYNSSDNFYGPVSANSARSGIIVFQIPGAAAHNLRLLYRPEIATETALVLLNV